MCFIQSHAKRKFKKKNRSALSAGEKGKRYGKKIQLKYVKFLSEWRTDLGEKRIFITARAALTTA